ncbi:MAG: C39 family peptidase [Anaerolineales bacterium]|nr:C39 family peptidase [Anaerolineales bacterium]
MPALHLDPDLARSTARSLRDSARQVETPIQSLQRALANLEMAWQGGGAESFSSQGRRLTRDLAAQTEHLEMLIQRLLHEIDEWETVDQRGAALFRQGLQTGGINFTPGPAMPASGGGWGDLIPSYWVAIPTVTTLAVVTGWLTGVPAWLTDWFRRIFGPEPAPAEVPVEAPAKPRPAQEAVPPVQPEAPAKEYVAYHDVPVKSQGSAYGNAACSPTSVSMVMDYYHNQDANNPTATPQELIDSLDKGDGTPGNGISLSRMADEINDVGYSEVSARGGASLDDLHTALDDGPVVVTVGVRVTGEGTVGGSGARALAGPGSTTHAVVVKGRTETAVIVNDPWSGQEMEIPNATFNDMWNRGTNGLVVIRP